jgi:sugar lactone lactonase YvrE
VSLTLSDDKVEPLNAASLRQDAAGALYCDARGGSMVARFDRHAQQQLEPLLKEDERGVYLALGDQRVRPSVVTDPLLAISSTTDGATS